MALIFQALFVALLVAACSDAARIGSALKLSRISKNFGRMTVSTEGLSRSAEMAGYSFGIVGAYWRSNTLAAYAQMSRGEIEEAMATIQLAIATLTVWDLGQGVAYPVVHSLVDKIVKNKRLFQKTLKAYSDYRNVMKSGILDDATRASTTDALKAKLLKKKKSIGHAFTTDVKNIMQKKQLYTDLVVDLKGIKRAVKAAKWASVIVGPLFDAANVIVSGWQLGLAIKRKDPVGIATSSLSIASGLAGVTGFVVGALATTGSTLAAVAGPVGALVGAVLGLTSILVEIFTTHNPYRQIERDVKMIKDLRDKSKKLLDRDIKDLPNLVPQRRHFQFSWVYQLNQGLLIENLQGRWKSLSQRVEFKLENPPKEENGYLVVGPKRHLDKSKYPSNLFWNPQGLVDIGYDFYGKKVTGQFKGATVIVNTNLVAGKPNVELKGLDITTYKSERDDKTADNVVIDDMYNMAPRWALATVKVKTGGGDDVIQINGLIGKPRIMSRQQRGSPNAKAYIGIYSADRRHMNLRRNNDVLSFEGMPSVQKQAHKIVGVQYDIYYGYLYYRVANDRKKPVSVYWGYVRGIKMFVGTPYDDIVEIMLLGKYIIIRQTRGQNVYKIYLYRGRGTFSGSAATIDDHSKTPGKIILESRHNRRIINRCLRFSKQKRILYIYEEIGKKCKQTSTIYFSKRANKNHVVRTEYDGIEMTLDQLPSETNDAAIIDAGENTQYLFDPTVERNQSNHDCLKVNVGVYPPHPRRRKFVFETINATYSKGALILSTDFINKCMQKANVSVLLFRSFDLDRPFWNLKFFVLRDKTYPQCPGQDFELPIEKNFARVMEQRNYGNDRLVADLYRDKRIQVDVNAELAKLDNRQSYHFDKQFEGQLGVSQDVLLKPPAAEDPPSTLKYQFDIKGGQQWDPDALIFTEELRDWLKDKGRRMVLKNKPKGAWKLEITKDGGLVTHSLSLKNIERIDYEPRDGSLRQPIVLDLATETKKRIDLETSTVHELLTLQNDYCENGKVKHNVIELDMEH